MTEIKQLAESGQIKMLTEDDFDRVHFPFEIFERGQTQTYARGPQ